MSGGVLCLGSIVYDTLVHPAEDGEWGTTTLVDTIEPHPGGNGANTALALARLGIAVRLAATVGNDEPGRFLVESLRHAGVDTLGVRVAAGATAASVALVNGAGERRFLHRMGVAADAFAEPIEFTGALTAGMARFHMASLFILPRLRAQAAETMVRARAAGLATSLDTNWDPLGRWMEDIGPCLSHTDIVFVNEDEARMATGHGTPRRAAEVLLAGGARMAVIKLGARGCAVYSSAGEIRSPGYAVAVRDTTGAGDCFVGGFLAALLRGDPPAAAARFANAVGAIAVGQIGGAAGLKEGVDVDAWISARAE